MSKLTRFFLPTFWVCFTLYAIAGYTNRITAVLKGETPPSEWPLLVLFFAGLFLTLTIGCKEE